MVGGGDEGTRTPDPRDANAVLFQLSYIPTGSRGRAEAPDRSQSVARTFGRLTFYPLRLESADREQVHGPVEIGIGIKQVCD